jgi:hypothetical protein
VRFSRENVHLSELCITDLGRIKTTPPGVGVVDEKLRSGAINDGIPVSLWTSQLTV